MQKDRMYHNLLELCSVSSISETKGESEMAEKIVQMLNRLSYFKNRPGQVQMCPMQGDKYNRSFVYAFMQGKVKSAKTVILLSHFDVVGVEEFGIQRDMAFDPVTYTEFLRGHPEVQLPQEARMDLESGDYLFGRGTMDMKFGIAADMEMLAQAEAQQESFEGNLLFLSVPDEEANSAGMLAAVDFLLSLKNEKGLEYVCCIVSEPYFPKYPGDSAKYIYTGTVGKLLPVFYCVGKETHVCEPFSGLNPNLLTAKIIKKIDLNPELSDSIPDVTAPAPVCLKQSDTKTAYSVQTPTAAYTYFNFMTLTKTPHEVMQCMLDAAQNAFEEVLTEIREKAKKSQIVYMPGLKPKVISFGELYEWCVKAHGEEFELHMKKYISDAGGRGDMRDLSVDIVKEAHRFCPYRDPMIVVFFAPPFYPHSDLQSAESQVMRVSRQIAEFAKVKYGEEIRIEPFFPGLSDMSYLGLSDKIDIDELMQNFPVWDAGYHIPLNTISKLNIPFMNIGPLGKDAHRYTERLCLSYSFEKAARLIWAAIQRLLNEDDDFNIEQ